MEYIRLPDCMFRKDQFIAVSETYRTFWEMIKGKSEMQSKKQTCILIGTKGQAPTQLFTVASVAHVMNEMDYLGEGNDPDTSKK